MLTFKTAQAYGVLAALYFKLEERQLNQLFIQPYMNGREQGFSLEHNLEFKQVSFSEARSSDDIVVYLGKSHEFDEAGNIPNAKVYEKAQHFDPLMFEAAADCIIKHLFN